MSIQLFTVDVSAQAAYPAAGSQQVVIPFVPKTLTMSIVSGTEGVKVSFDGVNDHIQLTPGTPLQGYVAQQGSGMQNVWLKRNAAGAGIVHLIAEG